tara:strand:- start:43 stop:2115 length:2073 start_codon:yes stop_codon:yes gene_type:complete
MLQADRTQANGLGMNELDFEFMTKGDPVTDAQDAAGRIQQNLTPEEMNEMAELAPYAEKFMMLLHKSETGEIPSAEQADQMISQLGQEMSSTGEQGMPSEQGSGTMMAQDMQSEASVPPMPVEMSKGGNTVLEAAKNIVREKHPKQAQYLDDLNIVMKPNMEGTSEYRSGDYEDSDMYGNKHTIELNPEDYTTPEEIASAIAGETLHHMKDKDPEFRKMWLGLRETLGEDENFRGFQEKRQRTMNENRQEEYVRKGRYNDPVNNKGPYNDTRDVDHFIDASAMDEWIRAYQFKDDPIAGKHYDPDWENDEFFSDERYAPQFDSIKQYLKKGMAEGGEIPAGPVGVIDQPGADNSGVADDVPAESDGFVINAAAVRKIGLRKVNDIIQKAIKYAQEQGMQLDLSKTPVNAEEILVSNGEVIIPDVLARIIGYDELEEINALGAEETEEVIEEQGEEPMKEMPLALKKGANIQEILGRYAGPFPAEDEMIQEEVRKEITPYSSEDANYVDMDRIKEVYSLYYNPETKKKTRGKKQRDYNNSDGVWMTHLEKARKYKLQPGIAEDIREVMPAFDNELKSIGMYNPEALEYLAKIESKGGKSRVGTDAPDFGVFQVNMDNVKKYFTKDTEFKKFAKFYGKKATATTGVSATTLRQLYLDNPKEFQQLMIEDTKTNLAVGLAITLLPNMWKTRDK